MSKETVDKKENFYQGVLKKSDLRKIYWRLQIFGLGLTATTTGYQAIAFLTAINPALKKIYKDAPKEERVAAMQRHLTMFLSQNTATGIILGITAALEETTTEDEKEAVVAVKSGMMGPLAGIGDSVFKITIQAIAGSIGAAYAMEGSILGPILMFLIYNGINISIKYLGVMQGYEKGVEYITSGEQAQAMDKIINFATMVGVIVLGALVASYVKITIGTELVVGETVVKIQELLDGILPKLLPLLLTVGLYKVHAHLPRKYMVFLILGIIIFGTLLYTWGVLA